MLPTLFAPIIRGNNDTQHHRICTVFRKSRSENPEYSGLSDKITYLPADISGTFWSSFEPGHRRTSIDVVRQSSYGVLKGDTRCETRNIETVRYEKICYYCAITTECCLMIVAVAALNYIITWFLCSAPDTTRRFFLSALINLYVKETLRPSC